MSAYTHSCPSCLRFAQQSACWEGRLCFHSCGRVPLRCTRLLEAALEPRLSRDTRPFPANGSHRARLFHILKHLAHSSVSPTAEGGSLAVPGNQGRRRGHLPKAQSENSQKPRFALTPGADTRFPFSADASGSEHGGRGGAGSSTSRSLSGAQALGPHRRPAASKAGFYGPSCHAEAVKPAAWASALSAGNVKLCTGRNGRND